MTPTSRSIIVRITKKSRVLEFASSRGWHAVGEAEWAALRAALPDVSESTIRAAGLEIAAPWKGVAQHSLDELESSLCELTAVYGERPELHRYCRDVVIEARARALFASRSQRVDEEKRRLKADMAEWMLVWLGDPAMFPVWVELRRAKIGNCSTT